MNKSPLIDRLPVGLYVFLLLSALVVLVAFFQTRRGELLLLLIPISLVGLSIYFLQSASLRRRRLASLFAELDRQARRLLHAAPTGGELPELLATPADQLFPACDLVIWLGDGTTLFQSRTDAAYPLVEMEAALAADAAGYCFWRIPDTAQAALLAAIGDPLRGGICVVPPAREAPVQHLPAARAVADQIAGALQINDRFSIALAEQADSYEQAIYTQAYRAELLTQTLALQRVEQELAVAWRIQSSFLPDETPDLPGWQLAAMLEPARQMSGDFYDFIQLPDHRLGLVVADVADKGLGPALFMALCRTLIRTYAHTLMDQPDEVLATVNRRILEDTRSDLFVTVFYAVLRTDTGEITYCNAGHNPPYLLRAGEPESSNIEALTRTALPLGIMDDLDGRMCTTRMAPGDLLVLYTDGITEAQDEEEAFFGEERLRRVIERSRRRSASIIGEKLVGAVYDFIGEQAQSDDITLMVVVREEQNEASVP